MTFDPVSALLDVAGKVIDRVFPDPVASANAKLELIKLQQSGELAQLTADTQIATKQADINEKEAESEHIFVSGWRPFIGWVCGVGFGVQFVIGPLGSWGATLLGYPVIFPTMDLSEMMPLLFGMLGLGAYRTYEKVKK